MTLKYQRLRAPVDDGGTLQIPLVAEFPAMFAENQRVIASHQFELAGKSIRELRICARQELLDSAFEYTRQYKNAHVPSDPAGIVMAGHQPTLFHPGVWFKNFVLDSVARQTQAVAVNLVIDNDHHPLRAIRVPTGSVGQPLIQLVKFDSRASSGPFETEPLYDRDLFVSFADRTVQEIRPFVKNPLVSDLWSHAKETIDLIKQPSLAIAAARHRLESGFGLNTLEVPISRVCQSQSFSWFLADVVSRCREFGKVYNQSLEEYRAENRIRSTSHPVPALDQSGEWLELPFWIWRAGSTKRQRLFVRSHQDKITLSDRDQIQLDLDARSLPEQLNNLESQGVSVRTRALTTTMYSRLVLSDAFFHGIGGAKYDQLTDQIISGFYGVSAPAFGVATATCRLPIDFNRVTEFDERDMRVRRRQLKYHAERFVDPDNLQLASCVSKKRAHLNNRPDVGSRKNWHGEMESINAQLQPGVQRLLVDLESRLHQLHHQVKASNLLGSREFSFCLFDESLVDRLKSSLP